MRIKIKFVRLFFVLGLVSFSVLVNAMEVKPFTASGLEYFKNKNITGYLVSGIGVFGKEITINTVYKTYPTRTIPKNGVVRFESLQVEIKGFRRPTHLVFVIHSQSKHALNSVASGLVNGLPITFESPRFEDELELVPESDENKKLLYRKSVMLKALKATSEVNFNE